MNARNPYDLAFTFALERLLPLLEGLGQTEVRLVAEARGKREDGTYYIDGTRFRRIQFRLEFRPKAMNIIGTQMADLAAYPIARYVLDSRRPNPAYEVIKPKFYRGPALARSRDLLSLEEARAHVVLAERRDGRHRRGEASRRIHPETVHGCDIRWAELSGAIVMNRGPYVVGPAVRTGIQTIQDDDDTSSAPLARPENPGGGMFP